MSTEQNTLSYQDALWISLKKLSNILMFDLTERPNRSDKLDEHAHLKKIADLNGFRIRQVRLGKQFQKHDNGALLVFYKKIPCVLSLDKKGIYQLFNPCENTLQNLTENLAKEISEFVYMIYPGFHIRETKLTLKDIVLFSFKPNLSLIKQTIALQIIINILLLILPIITGLFIDHVIPNADIPLLWEFTTILMMGTIITTLFYIAQAVMIIRLRIKMNVRVQPAIWDRLLKLPHHFFNQFSSGDLANRAYGMDSIQQQMAGNIIKSIISGFVSIITIVLLFYYNLWLGLTALMLAIIYAFINTVAFIIKLFYERGIYHTQGKLVGMLFQLFNGIAKLRTSSHEINAFTKWKKKFLLQTKLELCSGNVSVKLSTISASYLLLITVIIFTIVKSLGPSLSLGSFVAFNAAFIQFFAALGNLTGVLADVISIIPLYERTKPILNAIPEDAKRKNRPEVLTGKIELVQVSFKYDITSPFVLNNISMQIAPGEHIALIGPSGSGKSTLIKLILGFLSPTEGKVTLDNQDINDLSLKLVRQQMGVVLQNSQLTPTTMFQNIVGGRNLSEQEAWQAAELVGIKKDIEAMPMGMQTIVTEGGKTLSGGQRQRILIARAIIHKPKIILLDEATNSLDAHTQCQVMENIATLNATVIEIFQNIKSLKTSNTVLHTLPWLKRKV